MLTKHQGDRLNRAKVAAKSISDKIYIEMTILENRLDTLQAKARRCREVMCNATNIGNGVMEFSEDSLALPE